MQRLPHSGTLFILGPLFVFGILLGIGRGTVALAQGSDSDEEAVPDYRLLRQEEDWSSRHDRSTEGPPLKYVPVSTGGPHLTVGGQVRSYARWYRNERWGRGPDRDGALHQRLMLHGSIEAASEGLRLRGFVQLKSGLVAERDGPVYPPDHDRLGVNQAFLELGAGNESARAWTLRVGRQELHYGAGRMIAVREGPNVRLGVDAVWGRYRSGAWRVDAFAARPTETSPGVLDNGWMPGRTLWGAHLRRSAPDRPVLSAYYFGTERMPSPADSRLRVTRHTIGARILGTAGRLGYDLEGAVQGGRYEHGDGGAEEAAPIRAWMLAGRLTYRFSERRERPTLGIRADLSSGDRGATAANETFVAPYPSGRYTGAGSRLGPGNLLNLRPVVGLRLREGLQLHLKGYAFWRLHATDAVYAIWGAPLRPASGTDARFAGVMPEGVLTWTVGRHVTLALEGSHFVPGAVLRESGPGHGLTHVGLRAKYVF